MTDILLGWNDAIRTGIEPVDIQHQRLFDIFNALYRTRDQNAEASEVQGLLQELSDYTIYHFRTEVHLMHQWPVNAAHKQTHLRAHREFRRYVHQAVSWASADPAPVIDALLPFLAQWILYHIMGMDADLAREIVALQPGSSPVLPARSHGPQYSQLFGVITALNSQLAQRAFAVLAEKRQWERQALRDTLTGLPNRLALQQYLTQATARARRQGGMIAVGVMDLDDFKVVNDTWGHSAGDDLLRAVAARLQKKMRVSDFVARFGGDEFVVVLQDIPAVSLSSAADIAASFNRLQQAVDGLYPMSSGAVVSVRCSLGSAVFPRDSEDLDTLIQSADSAMYSAKRHKRSPSSPGWQLVTGGNSIPPGVDAYDARAQALLAELHPVLQQVVDHYVEELYDNVLARDSHARMILESLTADELASVRQTQATHWRYWVAPDAAALRLKANARRVGRIHFLTGISTTLLLQAAGTFRRLLLRTVSQTQQTRTLYRLLEIMDVRLNDDLQAQIAEGATLSLQYLSVLNRPLPDLGKTWLESMQEELSQIAGLPGILDVSLHRLDSQGGLPIEISAGGSAAMHAITLNAQYCPALDEQTPQGGALVSRAWRTQRLLSCPSYAHDPDVACWHSALRPFGVKSVLAIPVLNREHTTVAGLRLFGRYPHQFESPVLQVFAQGLQSRLQTLRCRRT